MTSIKRHGTHGGETNIPCDPPMVHMSPCAGQSEPQHKALMDSLVTSYTTTATEESRMYEGIRLLNRSCPAVSLQVRRRRG